MLLSLTIALLVCVTPVPARAHDPLTLPELLDAFGWSFDSAEIKAERVADDFYVLFGVGGNIAVSLGANGVLIVDDQFPQIMPKIQAKIAELGGDGVAFAINTHWHFDHAEGNLALGPAGTWIVAQANSREMMRSPHIVNLVTVSYGQQAYPDAALPVITYDDTMQFHFNGERIDLLHTGPAHTTGDTAVMFRGRNAVHLGDVYNNAGYPFIDFDNGGSLDGVIDFCSAVLAQIDPKTVVIPGHGPIAGYADLAGYIDMLKALRAKIAPLVEQGASLAEVVAAKPTAAYDDKQGDSTNFVDRAYHSIKAALAATQNPNSG
jgi:glyoxylase-like metal-dependent hydrolase (beta-lactamase superfamily II)